MNLYAEDCVIVDNNMYMVAYSINLIYRVDLETDAIEIIGPLYDAPAGAMRVSACILSHNENLYFLPMNARWLSYLSTDGKNWKSIEIEDKGCMSRFFGGVIYNNQIHMIGSCYPAIVVVDLITSKIETLGTEIYDSLRNAQEQHNDCYIRKDFAIVDRKLYAASCVSNYIIIYDLQKKSVEMRCVGCDGMRFSGIAYDGKNFWLSARNTMEFYKWNDITDKIETFVIEDGKRDECYLGGVSFDGRNIVLTGMKSKYSYIIDPTADNVLPSIVKIGQSFTFVKNQGKVNYCMTPEGIIEVRSVDDFNKILRKINVNIEDAVAFNYINKYDGIIQESNSLTLSSFLDAVVKE